MEVGIGRYHGRVSDEQPLTRRAAREGEGRGRSKSTPKADTSGVDNGAGQKGGSRKGGSGGAGSAGDGPSGFRGVISRHPNAWMYSALGVIFLLLGTGAVFAGVAMGAVEPVAAVTTDTPAPIPPRAFPTAVPTPAALRTCTIDAAASDGRLGSFEGSVVNVTTGEVLFDRNAEVPAPPASVLKVLTATAALATIGPDFQMSTKVFEGSTPGTIVLVGGGDPTLSALPDGVESVYRGAPKMSDLAAQTKAKWEENHPGEEITDIILDANYWNPADRWDPSWERGEQTIGYHSEVVALMVDGDRANPQKLTSPRSTNPIARAGDAFVAALDLPNPVTVTQGHATPGRALLAEVKSQPIRTLIGQMLPVSDNTLAEMIARVVSKERDGGGSAASLASIIPSALANYRIDTTGITIRDGSGLSANNAVPALYVAKLMALIATGSNGLDVIKPALPIAGKTGTLASRFGGDNAIARGHVTAKTGTIRTSRALAGWVDAEDGSVLSFAFYALGAVKDNATTALDTVATGVFTCGNNLSNN